jgi:type I site-specific restriction endonuclease
MPDQTEADARINIDELLRAAGWDPSDRGQVNTEVPIRVSVTVPSAEQGILDPSPGSDILTSRETG